MTELKGPFWDKIAKACNEMRALETEEACEQAMNLVSMRPQPGTPHGDSWEAGFRYAWSLRNRMNG